MRKKVVSPAHRRAAAQQVVAAGLCSQRAACRMLRLARSTYGYRGRSPTPAEERLRQRLHELALKHPRYGYRRIAAVLRQEGWRVGKRHIQRLRRAEGLRVPPSRRKLAATWGLWVYRPLPRIVGMCGPGTSLLTPLSAAGRCGY